MKSTIFSEILNNLLSDEKYPFNFIYLYRQNFHQKKVSIKINLRTMSGVASDGHYYTLSVNGRLRDMDTKIQYRAQFLTNTTWIEEVNASEKAKLFIKNGYKIPKKGFLEKIIRKKKNGSNIILSPNDNILTCDNTMFFFLKLLGAEEVNLKLKYLFS